MIADYKTENIRNIAVVGHNNIGKSKLIESLLYFAKVINDDQRGKILDFDEEEKLKGYTIHSDLIAFDYENIKINMIDTPGISDFVGEVLAALRVVEGAIFVLDAEFGIQIETEKIWHYADENHIPRVVYITRMDKPQADFFKIAEDLQKRFHVKIVPLEIPIGKGEQFEGVIDLLEKKAVYPKGNTSDVIYKDIPAEYKELVDKYSDELRSVAAEVSEELELKYLEGKEFTDEEIKKGLSECIKKFKIVPIVCGSTAKNIGMTSLLKLIKNEMPSPDLHKTVLGFNPDNAEDLIEKNCNIKESFSAFIFKSRIDQYSGKLNFVKILSGSLKNEDTVLVSNKKSKVKVARLYSGFGEKVLDVPALIAGDIGILSKIDTIDTNDSLCDVNKPVMFNPLKLPKPIYFQTIHHEDKKVEEKIFEELYKVKVEDPTFAVEFDKTTKEYLIKGMGDLQLHIILDKISRKLKTEIKTNQPKVPYKETIASKFKSHYKHKKQSGGHGQYGEVHIEVEPLARGKGFEFVDKIVGGRIPKNFIPGVEKGLVEAMEHGVLAGYPVEDIRVTLFDGSFHEVDSSELSFKIAAFHALKDGMAKAKCVILEPIMNVKVQAETDITGEIMTDITGRRGRIIEMHQDEASDKDHPTQKIQANIPLSQMLTYALDLKSITKGKASFDMDFDHYEILPEALAEKVIASSKNGEKHG